MTDPFVGPVPKLANFPREFRYWLEKVRQGRIRSLRFQRLYFFALDEDPPDPPAGQAVMWLSDGTDSGNAGDIVIKENVGGTVSQRII
jgi:hypothetical protein